MISYLPVSKGNLIIPGVEPKEEKSDVNESDAGN